jgi:hypothetical protein
MTPWASRPLACVISSCRRCRIRFRHQARNDGQSIPRSQCCKEGDTGLPLLRPGDLQLGKRSPESAKTIPTPIPKATRLSNGLTQTFNEAERTAELSPSRERRRNEADNEHSLDASQIATASGSSSTTPGEQRGERDLSARGCFDLFCPRHVEPVHFGFGRFPCLQFSYLYCHSRDLDMSPCQELSCLSKSDCRRSMQPFQEEDASFQHTYTGHGVKTAALSGCDCRFRRWCFECCDELSWGWGDR